MVSAKQTALNVISNLPEECTMEDIQYQLYVYEKIKRGEQDADAGRLVPQEEAEARVKEWLKSYGRSGP